MIDIRTALDGFSASQGTSIDELSAPVPFTTSAPRIKNDPLKIVNDPPVKPTPLHGNIDFSQAQRTPDGRLCVIKSSSVETLVKDPILECRHKNIEKCHYTYVTAFNSVQEEVCEENFEKLCQITFKKQATRETVKKCYRPMKKVCNGQGAQECRTVYETSCTTRYVQKKLGKFVGETQCEKLPLEICGAGCITEEGNEECHNKEGILLICSYFLIMFRVVFCLCLVDTVIDVPEEICDLNPQKTCRFVTRLVPQLKPKAQCTTVPQEVCHLKLGTPRKETKPLKNEWCLDEGSVERDESYDAASQV